MELEKMLKLKDIYLELALLTEELIELSKRESDGEDVTNELESVAGRFMIKNMQIAELAN